VLDSLSERFLACAVVSGRPASFLKSVLGIGGRSTRLQAFGLYGAERLDARGDVIAPPPDPVWEAVLADAADDLVAGSIPGVRVDLKEIAATINWRLEPEREAEALALATVVAGRHGLDLQGGRRSAELLAPHRTDKGAVVRSLAGDAHGACFLGDDVGDLPGFAALAALGRRASFTAVRIAIASNEAPPGLIESSDVVLDGPAAALAFLAKLDVAARPGDRRGGVR